MAELRSLTKANESVALYAISLDAGDKSKELKQKIASDGKGTVAFPLLSDPDHRVIDAYGVRDRSYDGKSYGDIQLEGLPQPAVYVIGKDGRVAWASVDVDYKKRPSNTDIRAALNTLKK